MDLYSEVPEQTDRGDKMVRRSRSSSSSSEPPKKVARSRASHRQVDDADENEPKREAKTVNYKHVNGYFNFLQDFRAQNAHKKMPAVELARRAGEAWSRLSSKEREPYEAAAAANRKRRGKKNGVEKKRKSGKRRKRRQNNDGNSD